MATDDEVITYSENPEDESNDPHRTATSPKIIRPEITTQVVNKSTTQEPQESDQGAISQFRNKLLSKILAFKSYFMDQILSLEDKMKAYEINDIVQALYWKIRRPDINETEREILMREREERRDREYKFINVGQISMNYKR